MATIEVIPYRVGIMPDGRKVSCFSAGAARIVDTGLWTWGITDNRGNYTTGLSRTPTRNRAEARAIAREFAKHTGYEVKP